MFLRYCVNDVWERESEWERVSEWERDANLKDAKDTHNGWIINLNNKTLQKYKT